MQVPEGAVIELRAEAFLVGDETLSYEAFPAFREQVQNLVHDLVSRTDRTLFGSVCGRCGNSCKRPDVLVREHDVFRLRFRLGLTEKELYERYLAPAPSWNGGDSFLRLEDGRCPFLREGGDDTQASCTIYEDRPEDCRQFAPISPVCRKEPTRLIEELESIKLCPNNELEVVLGDGRQHRLTDEGAFCELVMTQLELLENTGEKRIERIARRTREILEESGPDADTVALRQLIGDIGSIGGLDRNQPDLLADLWTGLRKLEARPSPPRPEPRPESRVHWLQLTEGAVTALYDLPPLTPVHLGLAQYPSILERVQAFMRELLTVEDQSFQARLTEPDPPCFMCGECCRCYAVEIKPSDIDRLAELLAITPQEFVRQYTQPGRFSWNPGNRILNKEDKVLRHTAANPRLVPVQLVPERFERGCVFLDEREDGFFYCRVHSHKPQVCRGYSTSMSLCRKTNQIHHWGRQARRLVFVRLQPDEVAVQLYDDVREGLPAVLLKRAAWPALEQAASALEREVDEVLEAARRELSNAQ